MSRPSKSCQTLPRKLTGLQFLATGVTPPSALIVAPERTSVASNPIIVRFKIAYCFRINLSFFISPDLSCGRWPYLRLCSSPVARNVAARWRELARRALQPLRFRLLPGGRRRVLRFEADNHRRSSSQARMGREIDHETGTFIIRTLAPSPYTCGRPPDPPRWAR